MFSFSTRIQIVKPGVFRFVTYSVGLGDVSQKVGQMQGKMHVLGTLMVGIFTLFTL